MMHRFGVVLFGLVLCPGFARADHWPAWSGGGPAGPCPAPHAETGPSLNCDPFVHVCARVASPVALLTSAVPAPPRSRNLSVPEPLGPSRAIQ